MLAILHWISQAPQSGQPVVITSWMELLTVATLLTVFGAVIGAYRHIECHQEGCHRLGRFPHGHLKLCHVHHPHVPSDGKINQTHIDAMTKRKGEAA